MIPEYDALYDLKKQWYYEFLPFLLNQPGIHKLILGGDVARRYVHQMFGLEKHAFDEYYTADSLKTLFETTPHTCIMAFLRESGFFYLI